jgi:hypothetical protein
MLHCRALGLPEPRAEVQVQRPRRWLWDCCWPEAEIVMDLQGATFANGAHVQGVRYAEDCAKLAAATLLGWRCFHATTEQVEDLTAVGWVAAALGLPLGGGEGA